jgi:hypothetical protein
VQQAFRRKYGNHRAFISGKPLDGRLALLTTTSALGRFSIYNRVGYHGERVFKSVGFTKGSGEFQFGNGFYAEVRRFALQHCAATAKHPLWGDGFRNRREVLRKALPLLGLSRDLLYHGVSREIYVVPLASNVQQFLRGEQSRLKSFERPAEELFDWFRSRWLLPRAARDRSYGSFSSEQYRIWSKE